MAVQLAVCLSALDASATTINIATFAWNRVNDGKCSFPEAVDAINSQKAAYDCPAGNGNNDTIQLQNNSNPTQPCGAGGTAYCALAGMPITLSKNVTILGYGTAPSGVPDTSFYGNTLTTADASMFYVKDSPTAKASVTFRNIVVSGAPVPGLTGIWANGNGVGSTINVVNSEVDGWTNSGVAVDGMNLNVQTSWFFGNSCVEGGAGVAFTDLYGFGGNLNVSQSSFTGNTSQYFGGGIWYGGVGTSTLVNSTIANNSSNGSGGGLELGSLGGSFAINGCTIAYNNCGYVNCAGAGVDAFANEGTYSMNASIVADNVDDPVDLDADDWNSDGSVAESNSIIQASLWGIDMNDKWGNQNGVNPFPGVGYT